MANRNHRDRTYRDDERYGSRQAEQFQDTSNNQQSDYGQRYEDDWQMNDSSSRPTNFYYEEVAIIPRSRTRNRASGQTPGDDYGRDRNTYGNDYRSENYAGSSNHRDRGGRGFQSFTSQDQGARDFSREDRGRWGAGYGGNYAGYDDDPNNYDGSRQRGYGRGYGASDRSGRGFFDKAGDEIASWFGDEDAARRREMDHRGRGPANYTRTDERVLEDVCDELTDDWGLDARNVQVTVDKGEVTLDGTVDSRRAKRRAEDIAHDISGVNHVQNNLRVQDLGTTTDRTSDTTLTES